MAIRLLSSENITGNINVSGTGTFGGTVSAPYITANNPAGAGNGTAQETARFVNMGTGATSSYMYIGAFSGTDWRLGKNILGTAGNTNFSIAKHSGTVLALEIDTSNNTTFAGNITFGATNPFIQTTNVLSGSGSNGARIRSAVSTAANPTFSNSDDTNTGMFFPSADNLAFSTAGTQALSINSSQNATFAGSVTAVGTLNTDNITVGKGDGNNSSISLTANTGNWTFTNVQASRNLEISDSDGTGVALTIDTNANATFAGTGTFTTATNRILTLDSTTTSGGYTIMSFKQLGTEQFRIFGDHTENYLTFYNDQGAGHQLTLASDGNVGIGTTSPSTKLHVSNSSVINDAFGLALVENTTTGTGSAANSALNIKSKYGTSQFMQWENNGLRIGSRIIDNGATGDVYFTAGADSVKMVIKAGGNVGIGTATPGEKLVVNGGAYISGRDIGKGVNLATSQGWTVLTPGNVNSVLGYFGGNFGRNGSSNENEIIWGTNHADQRSLIWKSTNNDTGSDGDGGWDKGISTGNDNMGYMSYVYVKRTNASTNGSFYFGCSGGNTLSLGGTAIGNPYFMSFNIGTLPLDVWCLAIGHIQANNDSNTTNNPDTGVYRLDTGSKISGGTSYKMGNNGGSQSHRTYLYYSTDPNSTLSWVDPGFYAIDGTQPTMAELFDTGTPTAGGSSAWTTSGNDIYNNNSADVGIGVTNPGAKLEVNGDILLTYLKATGNSVIGGSSINSSRLSVQDSKNGSFNSPHFQILGNGYSAHHYLDTNAYNIVTNSTSREIRVIAQNGGVKLAYQASAWAANSDIALKENVKPLENVLDKIKDYRCVEYNLKESPKDKKIGFIAQDWENDFPAIVDKDENDMLGMKYTETIPVLLKAIQELKAEIEILKTQIK